MSLRKEGDGQDEAGYLRAHAGAIEEARRRIAGHVLRTPLLTTDMDPLLLLKAECFQVTGSFKARGAFNAVLALRQATPAARGVIAVSSGNHAQAVALAARSVGLEAVMLIPEGANPAKVEATRRLGAEVIQEGVTFENREARARKVVAERGLHLVHPFDDWDVIHGAASAASEVLEDAPREVAVIATPVGGGGLLSGTALAARALAGRVRVVGVEPERADDAARTLRERSIQTLPGSPDTIADGVRVVRIGERNFDVMVERGLVDDIVTVSEEEIEEAVRVAWSRLKLALEPTGALPLAAHLAGKIRGPRDDGLTALILTGGNFDPATVARILGPGSP
ncbi:MAG: threonine ammonia-lyase [Candidatus Dormibacterales bacterium]